MILKERDWSLPLEGLDRKFDECHNVTAEKFHIARSDFLREWRFLEILWERLQDEWKFFHDRRSKVMQAIKNGKKSRVRTSIELVIRSFDTIHLDTNCFLLNARILMDRVAYLTTFLWRKIAKQQPKWRSFNEHKKSLGKLHKEGKIIDEDYALYVLRNTSWFEKKLKPIRDDLIVHREHSYIDAMQQENLEESLMRGKAVFRDKDGKTIVEYDTTRIPDLTELMDNICDFLDFFDKHFSQMLSQM